MNMHFDLVDLKLFVLVCEENSITRGATRAHLSLSAASMRIKNLEQTIGAKLLHRGNSGLTLMPAGHTLLHHAKQVLSQLASLSNDLQEHAKGIKGHLRMLANTTAVGEFLPTVMRTFLIEHPDVNIDFRERLSADIVRAVREGTADLGIIAGNVRADGLETMPYRQERLVLATTINHPLARRASVRFAETLDYDYIGLHENSAFNAFLEQAAKDLARPIMIRMQVSGFDTVCRLIEANIGIGLLLESAARRHANSMAVRIIPLEDEWAIRNLLICVRSFQNLPGFVRKLIDLLIEDAESAGGKAGDRASLLEFT